MAQIICPKCGQQVPDNVAKCPFCGAPLQPVAASQHGPFEAGPSGKSRGVAALLAFFIGTLGIQYFYLGKAKAGIIFILITIVSCGIITSIISLIQAIMMFTMTEEKFEQKYVNSTSTLPLF
ncbi:MAG: TM2 domain-containing protein [Muribaculaceae bacterium]|jgi:TM2 domain-containing membrane protein YozV/endogenous inhibitor of DNA gyrase (YacG/DUF329 family)|nr:TM2 domain-containing protein [Muribaculaceae bacterium]